jgi:hypothetical protein
MPPMPRRRVVLPAARFPLPAPPLLSPLILPRERAPEHSVDPSSLSSASCPCRPTGLPLPCRLHTVAPLSPPSVSSTVPPSSAPFGPRLTSPVPSTSCRTRRRPPRPPKLRRLGTPPHRVVSSAPLPSATSGENPASPPSSAQPLSLHSWSPRWARYT